MMEANIAKSEAEPDSKISGISEEVGHIKEIVADAFAGGLDNANRALKRGRRSAEDALDSAVYQVKRRPLESVGVTFGIGLVCGLAIGWLASRNNK
jgi:ElaB/YqjD/DUF883 family membrane-anchored ribosome-binding protein